MASKYTMPNLDNATPQYIIDESAKLSIIENYAKKLRAFYKEALNARKGEDAHSTLDGETFTAVFSTVSTTRLDQALLKEKYPDIFAECSTESSYPRLTFKLKDGVVNPHMDELMKELYRELDLGEWDPPKN